ncbi:MAG: lactate/malate family dehydrogenase, partial [Actinomycetes bacterium]
MNVAVVGAAGACGRQVAAQLLERRIVPENARLQLVGHRGGSSGTELWGLRADLEDAFADWAPEIELVVDPEAVRADVVVMMAGATVSLDPNLPVDRAALGRYNAGMFAEYAAAFVALEEPPVVVVQSNPVELGVHVFAEALPPHKVLGAAGWSDTLRFRHELAVEFGVPRRSIGAFVVGQHGDHMVPVWSMVAVQGVSRDEVADRVARIRRGRSLADLPEEIVAERTAVLDLVRAGRVADAYARVQGLPADLRVAVKPFFTNFTSGRTTEAVTAHAATDIVAAVIAGQWLALPAQVAMEGRWHGVDSPLAAPVVLGPNGWVEAVDLPLADDELAALRVADSSVRAAIA